MTERLRERAPSRLALLAFAVLSCAAFSLAMGAPAAAQGVKGLAIAQAPEEGYFACAGDNADAALGCARAKCRSAVGDPCYRVRWCYPAGFSGAMSYVANNEVSQLVFLCGAPSVAGLTSMLAAHCAAEPAASQCRLVAVWDAQGNESPRADPLGKNTD